MQLQDQYQTIEKLVAAIDGMTNRNNFSIKKEK